MGFQGAWERGDPIGQSPGGYAIIAPEDDSDDIGIEAYVTSNATDFFEGFLFGTATLTSPEFDLSNYDNPIITYQTHFWASDFGGNISDEEMIISLNNGTEEVVVDTINMENHEPFVWNKRPAIVVADYLSPSSTMTFKVVASQPGGNVAFDAGFDDFLVADSMTVSTIEIDENIAFNVYPNPSEDRFVIDFDPQNGQQYYMNIYDVVGKIVSRIKYQGDKNVILGEDLNPGIYFIQLEMENRVSKPVKLIKQ